MHAVKKIEFAIRFRVGAECSDGSSTASEKVEANGRKSNGISPA
jgi:hypothetical protein